MITSDEYRVDILKVTGFAFMAPFGKIVLSIFDFQFDDFNIKFFICLAVSFLLLYIGIIIIVRGYEIMEYKEKKQCIRQ